MKSSTLQNKTNKTLTKKNSTTQNHSTSEDNNIHKINLTILNLNTRQGRGRGCGKAWSTRRGRTKYSRNKDRGRQRLYTHGGGDHRWKQSGIRDDSDRWHTRKGKWPETRGELLFKIKQETNKTKTQDKTSLTTVWHLKTKTGEYTIHLTYSMHTLIEQHNTHSQLSSLFKLLTHLICTFNPMSLCSRPTPHPPAKPRPNKGQIWWQTFNKYSKHIHTNVQKKQCVQMYCANLQ